MPHGVGAHFYSTLDSTNAFAKEKAEHGERGPIWIVAGEQSAGRGRSGRNWTSLPGNLYCSLLFAPGIAPNDIAPLPFIVALAVRDTFVALGASPEAVQCKWPNDVLLNARKTSGILIESSASGNNIEYLVVGIGMNLMHHPKDAIFPATNFNEVFGNVPDTRTVMVILADKVKKRLDAWTLGHFEPIRTEWLSCAWGIGEKRKIRTSGEEFIGTLIGLNGEGAVNVSLDDGTEKTIYVADIFPSAS